MYRLRRVRSSGLYRRVILKEPNNSGEHIAFTFRVEDPMKQETNISRLILPLVSVGFLLGLHFYPEDGGNMFFRNVWLFELYGVTTQKNMSS
jgi:hypothetical protein